MAEDEAEVQTGDVVDIDRSSVDLDRVVSPRVHLVVLPCINRVRVELLFIFNNLPYLLSIALS